MQDLDAPAGVHFKFRDFIECGDTWQRSHADAAFNNLPRQAATWGALQGLASYVLDPIWDHFGHVVLTFGFCSHALSGRIPPGSSVAKNSDQHLSCELNTKGIPYCAHLGASCDFKIDVADYDAAEVAVWALEHTDVDALYYYGKDRPLHISWSPEPRGMVVKMKTTEQMKDSKQVKIRRPAGHATGAAGLALLKGVDY